MSGKVNLKRAAKAATKAAKKAAKDGTGSPASRQQAAQEAALAAAAEEGLDLTMQKKPAKKLTMAEKVQPYRECLV